MTGIWWAKEISDAAVSILTAFAPNSAKRPYDDAIGDDNFLRYKWRGTDPFQADNVALRNAMNQGLPLVRLVGVGYVPGTQTQLFYPEFPVWLIGEEPENHQFVVAFEEGQSLISQNSSQDVIEISRRYNEKLVKIRHHQPKFRSMVIVAYEQRCAVCRLPFERLLDAAHIRADADGGAAVVTNGLALCKIHHGAFDSHIIGISPDYVVHVKDEVLETVDGPTLQHAIKAMDGQKLRQLPGSNSLKPDRNLLAERFEAFRAAS